VLLVETLLLSLIGGYNPRREVDASWRSIDDFGLAPAQKTPGAIRSHTRSVGSPAVLTAQRQEANRVS